MKIDNVTVCEPITNLVNTLLNSGYQIKESKVSDYHFNEVYILMETSSGNTDPGEIQIDNIEKSGDNRFNCKCHWSTVLLSA